MADTPDNGSSNQQLIRLPERDSTSRLPSRYLAAGYGSNAEFQGMVPEGNPALRDLFGMLIKHKIVIVTIAVSCLLLGMLYAFLSPRLYTAEATLEIRGYNPLLQQSEAINSIGRDTRRLEYQKTTTGKLKHLIVANKVLATDNVAAELKKYFRGRRSFFDRAWAAASNAFSDNSEERESEEPVRNHRDTKYDFPEEFLRSYLGLVDINPVHETNLVEISATTGKSALSQKIANLHSEVFIEHLREERKAELQSNIEALQHHSIELKDKLALAERQVAQYAKDNDLVALSLTSNSSKNMREENLVVKGISEITTLLAAATAKRIQAESTLRDVEGLKIEDASALDDESTASLRAKLQDLESESASLSTLVTPLYPGLQELSAKIQELKGAIRAERRRKMQAWRSEFEVARASEAKLIKQLELEKRQANQESVKLVQYNLLVREAESLRELSDAVLKELKQTQIDAESTKSNIFVSDYAAYPRKPSAPKRGVILTLSLILGIGLGVAVAVVLEMMNSRIETSEDAQPLLQLPSLGVVPSFDLDAADGLMKKPSKVVQLLTYVKDLKRPGAGHAPTPVVSPIDGAAANGRDALAAGSRLADSAALEPAVVNDSSASSVEIDAAGTVSTAPPVVRKQPSAPPQARGSGRSRNEQHAGRLVSISMPRAAVSEALRTIRASILFSSADRPPRLIAVTSSSKGEGKTTLTSNLAVTLAQAAHRTLLIDCDLRHSRVGTYFAIPRNHVGLVDTLTGQAPLDQCIVQSPVDGLWIIPAGSPTPNPTELVGSKKLSELLLALKDRFDYVLVDSPPVLPVADTLMFAAKVDGIVFITRSQVTERSAAREAVRRLRRVGANILGVVVNGITQAVSTYSIDGYAIEGYDADPIRDPAKAIYGTVKFGNGSTTPGSAAHGSSGGPSPQPIAANGSADNGSIGGSAAKAADETPTRNAVVGE